MLADAYEGQGDMGRAREYDRKAFHIWNESGSSELSSELVAAKRRHALAFLAEGNPHDACASVMNIIDMYIAMLRVWGINMMQTFMLYPAMAALKVLVVALLQMGNHENQVLAFRVSKDVEETEAILDGYWAGVLEETRWELQEQHPGSSGSSGIGGGGGRRRSDSNEEHEEQGCEAEAAEAQSAATEEGSRDCGSCSGGNNDGRQRRTYARTR